MTRKRKKQTKPAKPRTGREMHTQAVLRTLENPDFSKDHQVGELGNEPFVTLVANAKESAIDVLYARKFLAKSQKRVADHVRELWEAAGGKTAGIDLSQDRVDGGRGDPIVGRIQAAQELKRVRDLIGLRGYETLVKVCGEGRALTEIAPHKRERLTVADNLRADLDDLGTMWGYQTRQRPSGRAA